MRLFELFEAKEIKKVEQSKPRNFVAKNSKMAGKAGAHNPKEYSRKEKHPNKNKPDPSGI
jgi:hypothetical protein